jgi:polycystin 1L2
MRVWHDNSGVGNRASWFLKYIVVRDLQTMEKSHFISQQWFAVEKDDGLVKLINPKKEERFYYIFRLIE